MASETIVLRAAEASDVPALVRLLRRSWLVTWAPELPFEAVQAFARFDPVKMQAETEWPHFVVAVREGSLIGMMQVEDDRIIDLHVDSACWNGGIGSRLLEAGQRQIARSYPAARLEVRSFNTRARAFYAHRGWAEVRRYLDMECGSPVETVEMLRTL